MQGSQPPNAADLLQSAHDDGLLSQGTMATLNLFDVGAQIQAALGVSSIDIQSSEVYLVTVGADDSGSMGISIPAVCDGHKGVIDALKDSHQEKNVLMGTRLMRGGVINPYQPLEFVTDLTPQNYRPTGNTPLYDFTLALLAGAVAEAQDLAQNGIAVYTATLIVSDGADNASRARADDVAKVVSDMLRAETHIIAGLGIDDGYTDYRQVFGDMGIQDKWIITPKDNAHDIRQALGAFSKSVVRASQGGGATFTQTAMGGFANP